MYKIEISIKGEDGEPLHGQVIAFVCGVLGVECKHDTTKEKHRLPAIVFKTVETYKEVRETRRMLRRLMRGKPVVRFQVSLWQHRDEESKSRYYEPEWRYLESWFGRAPNQQY